VYPLLPLASALRAAGHGTGAGRSLLPEEISPESVADAVRALLSEPGYRDAAGRLADDIAAMPSPAETVPKLERLAAG
jgi:UDP:flavonoid glycosyltransferase YjiC (YdhE family)